ncbi:hypothetical protein HNY73_020987 [Argiope bruennichi]|uniref:Uncharacterized protein n=1 Tax=Argiope bruennichi TaxID=94029 RepID=A0A8T0E9V6_ARGBR|nr:hypothetical protein HNY73_020987 [Argiope bruennichi]
MNFPTLEEATRMLILNVHPKRKALYFQIIAVKCYYFARSADASHLPRQDFSFLLALWLHFLVRPYIPQSFFTLIFGKPHNGTSISSI